MKGTGNKWIPEVIAELERMRRRRWCLTGQNLNQDLRMETETSNENYCHISKSFYCFNQERHSDISTSSLGGSFISLPVSSGIWKFLFLFQFSRIVTFIYSRFFLV